jgi:methionyl-tRNA formyltransferase
MNIAAIGRTQLLYDSIVALTNAGHSITAIITAPAAPEYSRNEHDFERLAERIGAPVFVTSRFYQPDIVAALAQTELAISVNWISVLKQKHIDMFKYGILNAHAGDLPKYRGNACANWALLAGEREIVLTIHRMEANELDCGTIFEQARMPLDSNNCIADVYAWIEKTVPGAFVSAVGKLKSNQDHKLAVAKADDPGGFRCFPRIPEDGHIDWTRPAEEIHALVRASGKPFAGAYCYVRIEGQIKKLVILQSRVIETNSSDMAVPGHVLKNDRISGESWVRCGAGTLALSTCCYAGEGSEFRPGEKWRSIRMRLGVRSEDWLWEIYCLQQATGLKLSERVPVGQV